MNNILLGLVGFIIIHLSDLAAIKRIPAAKPTSWVLGVGLLICSLFKVSLSPFILPLPEWSTWFGWPLLIISAILLIYSLFINLPFHKTYVATGVADRLIDKGFYALVRHPGVPSFVLLMFSLVLVTRSILMLVAAPVFILMDIALVIIQDRFIFERMFPGYKKYRQKTPMLLPNRRSLRAFIQSVRQS